MNDLNVLHDIEELAEEERELLDHSGGRGLTPAEEERLRVIQLHLDQTWDLLRQRRARREFGMSPDEAKARPADIVENYQQ